MALTVIELPNNNGVSKIARCADTGALSVPSLCQPDGVVIRHDRREPSDFDSTRESNSRPRGMRLLETHELPTNSLITNTFFVSYFLISEKT